MSETAVGPSSSVHPVTGRPLPWWDRYFFVTERGSTLYANLLAQLVQPNYPMPMGVLYRHDKPTYEQLANSQVAEATEKQGAGDLNKLMYSGMVWEVDADGTRH